MKLVQWLQHWLNTDPDAGPAPDVSTPSAALRTDAAAAIRAVINGLTDLRRDPTALDFQGMAEPPEALLERIELAGRTLVLQQLEHAAGQMRVLVAAAREGRLTLATDTVDGMVGCLTFLLSHLTSRRRMPSQPAELVEWNQLYQATMAGMRPRSGPVEHAEEAPAAPPRAAGDMEESTAPADAPPLQTVTNVVWRQLPRRRAERRAAADPPAAPPAVEAVRTPPPVPPVLDRGELDVDELERLLVYDAAPAPAGATLVVLAGSREGVGKSTLLTQLALALSAREQAVVVAQANATGPDLAARLGVSEPGPTLATLGTLPDAAAAVAPTPHAHLGVVRRPADGEELPADSRGWADLLGRLRTLPADVVLLDAGTGSTADVLDAFVGADLGVIITVPDPAAVIPTYSFIKSALFHALDAALAGDPAGERIMAAAKDPESREGIATVTDLLAGLERTSPAAAAAARGIVRRFRPGLIVNRAGRPDDTQLAEKLGTITRRYLSVRLRTLVTVPEDPQLDDARAQGRPVGAVAPGAPAADAIATLRAAVGR